MECTKTLKEKKTLWTLFIESTVVFAIQSTVGLKILVNEILSFVPREFHWLYPSGIQILQALLGTCYYLSTRGEGMKEFDGKSFSFGTKE